MRAADGTVDRYVRVRKLGEGGSGVVWLVEDRLRPGLNLALKELTAGSRGREAGLRREFATLASLRHPNLAEVFELDVSPESGLPRFTLEYVEGEDLVSAVRVEGPGLLLEAAAEALRALGFLHDFGLIHRDVKPGNLLVRKRPRLGCRLVVLDFGLALRDDSEDVSAAGAAGTIPYLAPEILRGAPPSRRTDLYALGAVVFEAVHGRTPFSFDGRDIAGFRDSIAAGLGSVPSLPDGYPPGLAAWLREMLSPDPALRPSQASESLARLNAACETSFPPEVPASRAARLGSGPLPGREPELRALGEHLAPSEGPRVVFLCGGPGTGKTRLLHWLAGEAVLRGWEVVRPGASLAATSEPGGADPTVALVDRLRESASRHPTLALLDEVEVADGRVMRFLERVAREGSTAPVRVIAAVRPAEARQEVLRKLLRDVGIVPTLRRVDLGSLDSTAMRAIAERAVGSTAISEARVRWLLQASEGNPARAEALLVAGAWEKGGRSGLPPPADASAAGRLELLSDSARSWLQVVAALGDASEATVVRLLETGIAATREASQEVAATGLAREHQGRWAVESRAAAALVLARMATDDRARLFRKAGAALVEVEGAKADPWHLAQVWGAAGERERAVESAMRAAQQSQRHGDPLEAAERAAFAIGHLDRRDARRQALRLRQAEALDEAGVYRAAARAFGGVATLSRERSERAQAKARQSLALMRAGRNTTALRAAREARRLARGSRSRHAEAAALMAEGGALGREGRPEDALALLERSASILAELGDASGQADALHMRAIFESELRMPRAEADFLRALELYEAAGRKDRRLRTLIGLAVARFRAGLPEQARASFLEAKPLSEQAGQLQLVQVVTHWIALVEFELGAYDRALAAAVAAEEQALHLGQPAESARSRGVRAEILISCGRPSEAAALLRESVEAPPRDLDADAWDYQRVVLGHALLHASADHDATVKSLFDKALDGFRRRRRKRALLMTLVQEMERRARPGVSDPFEPVKIEFDATAQGAGQAVEPEMRVRVELARAAWLLERGNPEGAREAAAEAAEIADGTHLLALRAQARALLATAAQRAGRYDEHARVLERGREILKEAAERIEDLAMRRDFVDRPEFRGLTELPAAGAPSGERRVSALYEMIRVLNSESDPDALLETMLDMAIREVRAERGIILLRDAESDTFSVCAARNLEETETERDAQQYSRSIVAEAGAGRSVLALDAGHDERFRDSRSVSLLGIHSLLCVPLRSRGRIIGTVYLDTRRGGALFSPEDLRFLEAFADHAALALENVRARANLEDENRRLRAAVEERVQLGSLVGRSPAMQRVFDLIEKVASSDLPVLVQGESGTGKELVARAIHALSPLRRRTFLSENCASITETLLASELFGVTRGAYTGADRDRAGLFELADGGTLFLDEIADMSPGMQAQLLRVLQEGEIRRVGGERVIRVKVRLIAATNKDLHAEVSAGRFRQDLLYRLQVLMIQLPPVRERPGDVRLLVGHLLDRIAKQRRRPAPRVEQDVMALLERYGWPGNVRQIENSLQRLALLAGDRPISRSVIESDAELARSLLAPPGSGESAFSLERSERQQIARALAAAGGNRDRAARLLGISRATIYRKIREYGAGM